MEQDDHLFLTSDEEGNTTLVQEDLSEDDSDEDAFSEPLFDEQWITVIDMLLDVQSAPGGEDGIQDNVNRGEVHFDLLERPTESRIGDESMLGRITFTDEAFQNLLSTLQELFPSLVQKPPMAAIYLTIFNKAVVRLSAVEELLDTNLPTDISVHLLLQYLNDVEHIKESRISKALGKLSGDYWLATASEPKACLLPRPSKFVTLGRLEALGDNISNVCLMSPAPESSARADLLEMSSLPADTRLYILYVYNEVCVLH